MKDENNNIVWECPDNKTDKCTSIKKKSKHYIPVIKDSINPQATEIWTKYFNLLFTRFHLLDRLNKYSEQLKTKAEGFYLYIYPDGVELDKKRLLKLLIGDPREMSKLKLSASKEDAKDIIVNVFNYDYLSKEYREEFADLIQMLGVNVCPYCGRSFTTTVKKQNGTYIRANQVDHYFPKSEFPWLALSIWNWIPACGSCNLRKGNNMTPILYPYTEEMGEIYRFRTHPIKGVGYLVGARDSERDYKVSLDRMEGDVEKKSIFDRAKNEISMLGINELYSAHNGYVCELFRQRYIFGLPYIDDLVTSFPELFRNREDVRAMLYMKRIDSESIGSSPLDKLTRDINIEIDQLTGENWHDNA